MKSIRDWETANHPRTIHEIEPHEIIQLCRDIPTAILHPTVMGLFVHMVQTGQLDVSAADQIPNFPPLMAKMLRPNNQCRNCG